MDFRPAHVRYAAIAHLLTAALLLILPLAAFSQTAEATPKPPDSRIANLLDSLDKIRTPTSVSISSDGQTLAWAVDGPRGSELHFTPIAPAPGTHDRLLSPDTVADAANTQPGACSASHPNWSPDGKQLAFLSDCSDSTGYWQSESQDNIFVWTLAVNIIKQASHLHGAISDLQWSPDGKSIAFLYVENATRRAGALDAMKPWNGVIGEDGVEVQRVYAVDVATGRGNWISASPKLHVYEFTGRPTPRILLTSPQNRLARTTGGRRAFTCSPLE
jgi:dipeptidyl aminopeptidase/acylaminoacyl peptidase